MSTLIVGLTGSIGTGKSTVSRMLRRLQVPVHESDAIVHQLLAQDTTVIEKVSQAFPQAVQRGSINRQLLAQVVFCHSSALRTLEEILHPALKEELLSFIAHHQVEKNPLIVLDIPLLFEKGWQDLCDKVVVTDCDPAIQYQRVMRRPGMTSTLFRGIIVQQWPAHQKRARADYVLDTSKGLMSTFHQLKMIFQGCAKQSQSLQPV